MEASPEHVQDRDLPHQLQGREVPPNRFFIHKQYQQQEERQNGARQESRTEEMPHNKERTSSAPSCHLN